MDGTAIIYTHNQFTSLAAKTAHGLLRHGHRYAILAVIDGAHAGQDAGQAMDGKPLGIPIYANVNEFREESEKLADFMIIGIASAGGRIDPHWMPDLEAALDAGMSLVNGMHHQLADNQRLADLARVHHARLIDVRRPKPVPELHFWTGKIDEVGCPIVPVLGTDCAVGKRTTARFLEAACRARGLKTEMIYTGQTGWLQGGKYGFIFDSTLNDFVSGELEHAILQCWEHERPDLILIEGQAALRNPSGPCGSEFLVSGRADACVLVHPAGREYHKGWERANRKINTLASEVALVAAYGVPTLGIALNTRDVTRTEALIAQDKLREELQLPVVLPLEEGVEELVDALEKMVIQRRTN